MINLIDVMDLATVMIGKFAPIMAILFGIAIVLSVSRALRRLLNWNSGLAIDYDVRRVPEPLREIESIIQTDRCMYCGQKSDGSSAHCKYCGGPLP